MNIRQETKKDYPAVYALIKTAFAAAEHCDGNEQDLVVDLRRGNAFIPELSLVAENAGKVIGHILFSKAKMDRNAVLLLAPLSVLPEFQRQGVGTALETEGHKIAAQMGYGYSFVLGSESYYPRFGYLPAKQFGVEIPSGFPENNFMGIMLRKDARPVGGRIAFPKEFGL